jgi:hypothetical protein
MRDTKEFSPPRAGWSTVTCCRTIPLCSDQSSLAPMRGQLFESSCNEAGPSAETLRTTMSAIFARRPRTCEVEETRAVVLVRHAGSETSAARAARNNGSTSFSIERSRSSATTFTARFFAKPRLHKARSTLVDASSRSMAQSASDSAAFGRLNCCLALASGRAGSGLAARRRRFLAIYSSPNAWRAVCALWFLQSRQMLSVVACPPSAYGTRCSRVRKRRSLQRSPDVPTKVH